MYKYTYSRIKGQKLFNFREPIYVDSYAPDLGLFGVFFHLPGISGMRRQEGNRGELEAGNIISIRANSIMLVSKKATECS